MNANRLKEAQAKLAKLPVWAQQYIADLQRDVETTERQQREILDSQSPSNVYWQIGWPRKTVWAQTDRVVFKVGESEIEVRVKETGGIEIRAISSMADCLSVEPNCSNVVTVKATAR